MTPIFRRALGAGVAAAAIATWASSAAAQPTFDLELLDGGKPVPNAQVMFLLDEGKVPLGTTDADGLLRVDMDLVDVGKGQEVIAYEIECDGEIVIVFVLAEEVERFEEECELRRRENPECECRRIGAFVWGDHVVVDLSTRTVSRRPDAGEPDRADADPPDRAEEPDRVDDVDDADVADDAPPGRGFVVGVGADLRQMTNLQDVAAQAPDAIDADATTWAPGIQLMVELMLGFVGLGIEGGWSRMETETRFPGGVQMGDLDYLEIGATVRVRPWNDGPLRPYGLFGIFHTWNKADWRFDAATDHRTHITERAGLGAGVDWWPGQRAGLRFEALYNTTFDDGDADEHVRYKLGLLYRPFDHLDY